MPSIEQNKICGGGLQHTSKILTLEGLLKKSEQQSRVFPLEQKTSFSQEEQEKFYLLAKHFLDLKLQHKLIFPSEGSAQTVVDLIIETFGEGMASFNKVKTVDGRNDYVYTVNIKFSEIKQKYYPDISTERDSSHYLSDTLGKTG